jgi:hypothetical protein
VTGRIVIDSGVLLLLAVGMNGPRNCDRHRRTHQFGANGFRLLSRMLLPFEQLVTTPQVLAETWNLTGNESAETSPGSSARAALSQMVDGMLEVFEPSSALITDPEFPRLGFADVAQLRATAERACPIITIDTQLWLAALKRGIPAIHFTEEYNALT